MLPHKWEPCHYSLYSKILRICADTKSTKAGRSIHGLITTAGFPPNTSLNTRLILFYSEINEMGSARNVFDRMPERSIVTWTSLISGYSRNGYYREALKVFSSMNGRGVKPNQFTYGSALSACTRLMCLELGKQIRGRVQKSRFADDMFVQSALVDMHSKCGDMEDACRVFEAMGRRDLVSWNAMLGGYTAQGLGEKAVLVFRGMLGEGLHPDIFTFGSVLKSTAQNERLAKASIIHGYIIQFGFGSHKFLNASLIDSYVKYGDLDSAIQVYDHMQTKDLVSCTSLIIGYASHNTNCTAALQLFKEVQKHVAIDSILLCSMVNVCAKTASLSLGRQLHANALKNKIQHDTAICNALIDMYSKSGAVEDARRVFCGMEGKNVISWTSLIAGYGKNGHGHEALALYSRMQEEGLKPNDVTFLSLLFACSHSGLTQEGWECFGNMVRKHDILPGEKHYVCLVDLLGRAGRLEEARDLVCRICADSDDSVLGPLLGACSNYGDTGLGEIIGRRLLSLAPENTANYVVLSGIYAAGSFWDRSYEARMLLKKRSRPKFPGISMCRPDSENEALLLGI